MVDNLDEKLEENIALKSEDDETLSQKEIFDNCSSTVGGESPGNSIISNLSTEMEKFSIDITTCPQKPQNPKYLRILDCGIIIICNHWFDVSFALLSASCYAINSLIGSK